MADVSQIRSGTNSKHASKQASKQVAAAKVLNGSQLNTRRYTPNPFWNKQQARKQASKQTSKQTNKSCFKTVPKCTQKPPKIVSKIVNNRP